MEFALQLLPLLFLFGLVAALVRVSGHVLARTKIEWGHCLKYAAIAVLLLLPLRLITAQMGSGGVWFGALLAVAVHAAVGAFYLGPRVLTSNGSRLGPITGAKVACGAAFLAIGSAILLVFALRALRAILQQ
ncbi:hypothetical protein [Usitatibacter rugosus]|uniref:hypothetical protein n=1 Tax=Usitatibacter rugosus TaxID=2732067 RepID=UPI0014876FC4|nr:hypothetical protein [Usitatibacter rugosus]